MTYPTAAVTTTNLDASGDSPALARSDILDGIQKLNQMIAHTTAFAATLLDDIDAGTARGTLVAAKSGGNTDITSLTGIINGLGYAVGVGAGGNVTQNTSKSTAVTLNKLTGSILMANTSMTGPNGQVSFTCNNSLVGMRDLVIANVANSGIYGDYFVTATALNGSIIFTLHLSITGTLAEQVNIAFAVIKGSVT